MALELCDYERRARGAVKEFWTSRGGAAERQRQSGKADRGERGSVLSGKNMDGFVPLIQALVAKNGLPSAEVYLKRTVLTLPGYFRPTKIWDVLVMNGGRLIAAIELKSQIGPSFGNNFNNRAEEAIGTGHDLWIAYREGAFGEQPPPFIGWLMLVEDCGKSRNPVKDTSPHFPVFPEFRGASYLRRYDILCQRLVKEKVYSSACVMTSSRDAATSGVFGEMSELTGLGTFVRRLAAHIAEEGSRI